MFYLLSH